MGVEGGGEHLGAVAGKEWDLVAGVPDAAGFDEVFVEVIDEFADAVFEGGADADVIDHGEVLDEFAETDPAGVGTDGDVELCGEEEDGEVFVHTAETAGIDLTERDGIGLEQLLEEDAVHPVFAGGNADAEGFEFPGDAGVAEDVIGRGGFLDPPGFEMGEGLHPVDGLGDIPDLIGIDHQLTIPTDFLADDRESTLVIGEVASDLDLDVVPAFGDGLAAEAADLVIGITEPAGAGGVGGITVAFEFRDAAGATGEAGFEEIDGFVAGEGVGEVTEVDAIGEAGRGEGRDEAPDGEAGVFGPEIPEGIDDGGEGEVDGAFVGADPAELGIGGEMAPEKSRGLDEVGEGATDDEMLVGADGGADDFVAATDGEGGAVAFEAGVGVEDDVG